MCIYIYICLACSASCSAFSPASQHHSMPMEQKTLWQMPSPMQRLNPRVILQASVIRAQITSHSLNSRGRQDLYYSCLTKKSKEAKLVGGHHVKTKYPYVSSMLYGLEWGLGFHLGFGSVPFQSALQNTHWNPRCPLQGPPCLVIGPMYLVSGGHQRSDSQALSATQVTAVWHGVAIVSLISVCVFRSFSADERTKSLTLQS